MEIVLLIGGSDLISTLSIKRLPAIGSTHPMHCVLGYRSCCYIVLVIYLTLLGLGRFVETLIVESKFCLPTQRNEVRRWF